LLTTASANLKILPDKWKNHFLTALAERKMVFEFNQDYFSVAYLSDYKVAINLVDIVNRFSAEELIELQNSEKRKGIKLIHLWEDVWLTKREQVIFRLKSLFGLNKTIHGRKTEIQKIDKPTSDNFLDENHLQGTVSSRYKFGLYYLDELVAVATFSALRRMNHSHNYKSIELIRFAVLGGFSITGGLSKLIKHLKTLLDPDDIMTYADCDWSSGDAYIKIGFEQVSILQPQYFVLSEYMNRKLIKDIIEGNEREVFNSGSLKFILRF